MCVCAVYLQYCISSLPDFLQSINFQPTPCAAGSPSISTDRSIINPVSPDRVIRQRRDFFFSPPSSGRKKNFKFPIRSRPAALQCEVADSTAFLLHASLPRRHQKKKLSYECCHASRLYEGAHVCVLFSHEPLQCILTASNLILVPIALYKLCQLIHAGGIQYSTFVVRRHHDGFSTAGGSAGTTILSLLELPPLCSFFRRFAPPPAPRCLPSFPAPSAVVTNASKVATATQPIPPAANSCVRSKNI